MTDGFTHDAAPYVLGALEPGNRHAFEEHLAGCPTCQAEVRVFAGLPGLLSRLPADDLPALLAGEEVPAPRSVLPALVTRARAERRSRTRRAALVAAAAAVVAGVGGAAVAEALDRPGAAVSFIPASAEVPASAEARLTDVPGGTRIDLTCRYEGELDGRVVEYVLLAVPKDGGAPARLGSWPVLTSADYGMAVVVPMPRGDIDMLEVTSTTGRSLLTLRP